MILGLSFLELWFICTSSWLLTRLLVGGGEKE